MRYLGIEDVVIGGYAVRFERRKYSRTYYTWVTFKSGEDWIDLGDPWPVKRPKHDEILRNIKSKLLYKKYISEGVCKEDSSRMSSDILFA